MLGENHGLALWRTAVVAVASVLGSAFRQTLDQDLGALANGLGIYCAGYPFLNFYLVWNTGIGFGLASMETNIYYHILTLIIVIINVGLIFYLMKSKKAYTYFIALIIGGSLGNLFDRIYYYAVPDFIDLHLGKYHWFVFNVADIFITVGIIGLLFVELLKKEKISKNV